MLVKAQFKVTLFLQTTLYKFQTLVQGYTVSTSNPYYSNSILSDKKGYFSCALDAIDGELRLMTCKYFTQRQSYLDDAKSKATYMRDCIALDTKIHIFMFGECMKFVEYIIEMILDY